MSLPRRLALLDWARASHALIFEDDYDSEFRYVGRPVPALQSLDRHGVVLFAGSFSKVLFPSLRLGYLMLPLDLVDRFAAVLSLSSRHAPLLEQASCATSLWRGTSAVTSAARARCTPSDCRFSWRALGVISTACWISSGWRPACRRRVGCARESTTSSGGRRGPTGRGRDPLSRYIRRSRQPDDGSETGLHLGFAAADPDEIRRGVRELALALEEAR